MEINGLTFRVEIEPDHDMRAPWEEHDGHGPVREISGYGRPEKKPGEVIIYQDRGHGYAYDVQEAARIARRDGWGLAPEAVATLRYRLGREPTRGEVIAEAVRIDRDRMRAWCNSEWSWCGVVVTLLDLDGRDTGMTESLWGIESDSREYLDEVAEELACQIVDAIGRRKYVETGATRQRVRK